MYQEMFSNRRLPDRFVFLRYMILREWCKHKIIERKKYIFSLVEHSRDKILPYELNFAFNFKATEIDVLNFKSKILLTDYMGLIKNGKTNFIFTKIYRETIHVSFM